MTLKLDPWQPPDVGVLFVVAGASGSGKTTLVQQALGQIPGITFSVSATTRPPRPGEIDGKHYHFLTDQQFDEQLQQEAFLEWAEVFGNRYGTLRTPVEEAQQQGQSVLLEIDVQGAAQVREKMPAAVSIFVLPPSLDALEARLRARNSDTTQVIERRLQDARSELQRCGEFDYLVINEDLQVAHDTFQAIMVAAMRQTTHLPGLVSHYRQA